MTVHMNEPTSSQSSDSKSKLPPFPGKKNPATEEKSNPKKGSIFIKIILAFLILILIAGNGVLGFLYYKKVNAYKSLKDEKQALEEDKEDTRSDLESENTELESENAELLEEKTTLEEEVADYEEKQETIKAYNDFNAYVYYVIGIHGGFINLTDAEYQTAKSKAEATGDADLVAAVDSAWNDKSISQMIRFVNVMNAAIEGIDENCE
jgi:cell division protein FtsB